MIYSNFYAFFRALQGSKGRTITILNKRSFEIKAKRNLPVLDMDLCVALIRQEIVKISIQTYFLKNKFKDI